MHNAVREELAARLKDVTCSQGDAGELEVLFFDEDRIEFKGCCQLEQPARVASGADEHGNRSGSVEVIPSHSGRVGESSRRHTPRPYRLLARPSTQPG